MTNTLGTKTNAITINNTSGNISFKVEVPMNSLEGLNNSSLAFSSSQNDKRKPIKSNNNKKKQKTNKQGNEVRIVLWIIIYLTFESYKNISF